MREVIKFPNHVSAEYYYLNPGYTGVSGYANTWMAHDIIADHIRGLKHEA